MQENPEITRKSKIMSLLATVSGRNLSVGILFFTDNSVFYDFKGFQRFMAFSKEFQQISPGNVALHVNKAGQCIQRLASYKFPWKSKRLKERPERSWPVTSRMSFEETGLGKTVSVRPGYRSGSIAVTMSLL